MPILTTNFHQELYQLHCKLIQNKQQISTVESCTGGLLAWALTYFSGSSNYYKGGFSTYANEAKISLVGVKTATIEKFGAVSKETAIEMAHGCLVKLNTDFAVSITGIAGPTGGSEEKPVGTVWCGIVSKNMAESYLLQLQGDREEIRTQTVQNIIKILNEDII